MKHSKCTYASVMGRPSNSSIKVFPLKSIRTEQKIYKWHQIKPNKISSAPSDNPPDFLEKPLIPQQLLVEKPLIPQQLWDDLLDRAFNAVKSDEA